MCSDLRTRTPQPPPAEDRPDTAPRPAGPAPETAPPPSPPTPAGPAAQTLLRPAMSPAPAPSDSTRPHNGSDAFRLQSPAPPAPLWPGWRCSAGCWRDWRSPPPATGCRSAPAWWPPSPTAKSDTPPESTAVPTAPSGGWPAAAPCPAAIG